jgi:signal transduction histidine kinase
MPRTPFTRDVPLFLTAQSADAEALLLEMLTQLGVGVILLDAAGSVVFWNAPTASLTGSSLAEINAVGFVHVFEPPQRMAHLVAQATRGVPTAGEWLALRRADGGEQPVAVWCLPLHRADTSATRILVAMRVVSLAAPSSESPNTGEWLDCLGQLAGSVSHEIQNPLNAIALHTEILEEELAQPGGGNRTQLRESLAVVRARLGHLQDLVQEYLGLVRLAVLPRESVDLGALLEAWALEVRDLLRTRGLTLRLEGVADLGQVAVHPPTFGRALRKLGQVALEALPAGGGLAIRGWRAEGQLYLDMGGAAHGEVVGASPGAPPASAEAELGWALARAIVVAHHGELTVRQEPDVGFTCMVRLPLLAAEEATEE